MIRSIFATSPSKPVLLRFYSIAESMSLAKSQTVEQTISFLQSQGYTAIVITKR